VVGEEHLSALVAAGMIDLLEGRLKYAREFLELEAELQTEAQKENEDNRGAIASEAKAARIYRFPLLRHNREILELCDGLV